MNSNINSIAGKVSDITSVRKALGHRKWQNAQVEDCDIDEVRAYYHLIREQMMIPADALIQIASERNGYAEQCDDINDQEIDHSQHQDGEEETNGMVLAVRSATMEASLAMTDVADAASEQIVDAFYIALGANVVHKMTERSSQVRSNFNQITQAIRQTPIDLRNGSLPGKKVETVRLRSLTTKQISGLWGRILCRASRGFKSSTSFATLRLRSVRRHASLSDHPAKKWIVSCTDLRRSVEVSKC